MTTPTIPASPDSVEREELRSALAEVTQLLKDGDTLGASLALSGVEKLIDALLAATPADNAPRTLLEQYDREHQPGYQDGYKDGRIYGYEVGKRHAQEALLAATPAKEWVGLTDDEYEELREQHFCWTGDFFRCESPDLASFRSAIESKLREKNAATPAAGGGEALEYFKGWHDAMQRAEQICDRWGVKSGILQRELRYTHPQPQPSALPDEVVKDALNELGSCQDDYNYLVGITENKDNLHGWLRMRAARVAKVRAAIDSAMLKEGK